MIYAKVILGLILLAAIAGAVKWASHTIHRAAEADRLEATLKTERDENARNLTAISRDIAQGESDRVDFAHRFDAIDAAVTTLNARVTSINPAKLVQSRSTPDAPCPNTTAGPEFLGLYNEAASIPARP